MGGEGREEVRKFRRRVYRMGSGGWDLVVLGVWGGIGGEVFLIEFGDGRDMGGEGERRRKDDF